MPRSMEPLRQRNEQRATDAAARRVEQARAALQWAGPDGSGVPESSIRVAQCVAAHPGESWPEVARRMTDQTGRTWSKYTAASAFRRLLVAAGLAANGPGRTAAQDQLGGET